MEPERGGAWPLRMDSRHEAGSLRVLASVAVTALVASGAVLGSSTGAFAAAPPLSSAQVLSVTDIDGGKVFSSGVESWSEGARQEYAVDEIVAEGAAIRNGYDIRTGPTEVALSDTGSRIDIESATISLRGQVPIVVRDLSVGCAADGSSYTSIGGLTVDGDDITGDATRALRATGEFTLDLPPGVGRPSAFSLQLNRVKSDTSGKTTTTALTLNDPEMMLEVWKLDLGQVQCAPHEQQPVDDMRVAGVQASTATGARLLDPVASIASPGEQEVNVESVQAEGARIDAQNVRAKTHVDGSATVSIGSYRQMTSPENETIAEQRASALRVNGLTLKVEPDGASRVDFDRSWYAVFVGGAWIDYNAYPNYRHFDPDTGELAWETFLNERVLDESTGILTVNAFRYVDYTGATPNATLGQVKINTRELPSADGVIVTDSDPDELHVDVGSDVVRTITVDPALLVTSAVLQFRKPGETSWSTNPNLPVQNVGNVLTWTYPSAVLSADGTEQRFKVTIDSSRSYFSRTVTLLVAEPGVAPSILEQPVAVAARPGDSAVFRATASGTPTPDVQWQQKIGDADWSDIENAASTEYVIQDVATDQHGTAFRAVFTNASGAVTSEEALLSVTLPELQQHTAPGLSGTAAVGSTLLGTSGTTAPASSGQDYQWLRDGTPIEGATLPQYALLPADAGTQVSLQVTHRADGHAPIVLTSEPVLVNEGTLLLQQEPTVSGDGSIGATLTVNAGVWDPVPASVGVQWMRDGTAISGATGMEYVISEADLDTRLSVEFTLSAPGYADTVHLSNAVIVAPGEFADASAVLSGNAVVGGTLTAEAQSEPAPDSIEWQWFRDTAAIAGATGPEYRIVATDLGASITVQATLTLAGYLPVTVASDAMIPALGEINVTSTPAIGGYPGVGGQLVIDTGKWNPQLSSLDIQWLRNGTPIPGTTGRTLLLEASDHGSRISAVLTAHAAGYRSIEVEVDEVLVSEKPIITPKPSAANGEELSKLSKGGLSVHVSNGMAQVTLPAELQQHAGDWVHATAFSTPTPLGWIRVNQQNVAAFPISSLSSGTHRLALQDVAGSLLGWVSIDIPMAPDESNPRAEPGAREASRGALAVTGSDGALPFLGSAIGIVLLGTGVVLLQLRRRAKR